MVETEALLDDLLHPGRCYDAVDNLEKLSITNPEEAAGTCWEYLMRVEPAKSDMGIDATVVRIFLDSTKADGRQRVLSEWMHLSYSQREAIARGAYIGDAMPESLAVELFFAPGSKTHERHMLLAGLASSADSRGSRKTVLDLVDKVGTYPPHEEHRQRILESFLADVRREFATHLPAGDGSIDRKRIAGIF